MLQLPQPASLCLQGPMSPAQPRPSGMPGYAPPTGMTSYVPPGQPQQRPHQPLQFPGHQQVRPNGVPGMSMPQQRPPGNQFGSPAMNMPGMPMQQPQQPQQFQAQHPMQMQRPIANGMPGMYGAPPQAMPRPQVTEAPLWCLLCETSTCICSRVIVGNTCLRGVFCASEQSMGLAVNGKASQVTVSCMDTASS